MNDCMCHDDGAQRMRWREENRTKLSACGTDIIGHVMTDTVYTLVPFENSLKVCWFPFDIEINRRIIVPPFFPPFYRIFSFSLSLTLFLFLSLCRLKRSEEARNLPVLQDERITPQGAISLFGVASINLRHARNPQIIYDLFPTYLTSMTIFGIRNKEEEGGVHFYFL